MAETSDIKKVIDLFHSWGKLAVLSYTRLTIKMVKILAVASVKRPSDPSLLRITPRAIFWPVFGTKNAQSNHPYGPTITVRWSKDEWLCQVALVREYLAITKDRE